MGISGQVLPKYYIIASALLSQDPPCIRVVWAFREIPRCWSRRLLWWVRRAFVAVVEQSRSRLRWFANANFAVDFVQSFCVDCDQSLHQCSLDRLGIALQFVGCLI